MEAKKELLFKKFVRDNGVDKFTKVQEYSQCDSIILNGEILSGLSKSLSGELEYDDDDELGRIQQGLARARGPKFTLKLKFIYRKKGEVDIIMVELGVSQFSFGGDEYRQGLLKDGSIFLLFDEGEAVKLENGDYHAGTNEELYFQSDLNFLLKAVNSKKVEYRCLGKRGVFSEGSLSDDDLLKIKGFYAALFDPEFDNVYDVVLKRAEEEKAAEKRKIDAEKIKKEEKAKREAERVASVKARKERLEQLKKEIIDLDVNKLIDMDLLNGNETDLLKKIKEDETNIYKSSTTAGYLFILGLIATIYVWWAYSIWYCLLVGIVMFAVVGLFNNSYKKKIKNKVEVAQPELNKLLKELTSVLIKN